ncbi:Hypothetical predicted protein [Cloeon dipterum]|uniref:Ig-like domain-containing protein n=1 Tax=Cloeon dipterum TaxID=197152 RepID=A0A8S1CC79_9INSE|nr:Hypothetical predicted protein [Cloeon dipterum]
MPPLRHSFVFRDECALFTCESWIAFLVVCHQNRRCGPTLNDASLNSVLDETGREEGAMVNTIEDKATSDNWPEIYKDAPHFRRVGDGPEYCLEIPCAKLDFTGACSVIAKNCYGEAKAVISLQITAKGMEELSCDHHRPVTHSKVQTLPSITRSLRDRCCDGDTVTYECGLAPTPVQPDVRWEKDGKPLVIEGDLVAEQDSTFARLTILQVYPEDEGEYTCVVRSKLGKVLDETGREEGAMVNVRATANGKPPLDDVRGIEPRPSRTKQPPTTGPLAGINTFYAISNASVLMNLDPFTQLVLDDEGTMPNLSPPLRKTIADIVRVFNFTANCPQHWAAFSALAAATSTFLAVLPSTSSMAAHFSPARAIFGKPSSSGNVELSRDLIPNSLRQHLQRVNVKPVPSLADALKKAEPPSIQATPATRVLSSDLKIALSFTEKQQKLIALRKLIPFTDDEVSVEDAGLYRVTLENDVGRVEASARLDVIGRSRFRKVRVTRVHNPIGTVSQPVSKKEPWQILKVEEMVKIEKLCQKDKLLEDQRKIIVEIQIKLDEKQKELEELRQSLDTQDSAVDWLEADKQQLQ